MDKDTILSTFQEITGTDDTGFAVEVLERLNWDLEVAANHIFTYGHTFPEVASGDITNPQNLNFDSRVPIQTSTHVRPCDMSNNLVSVHSPNVVYSNDNSRNSPSSARRREDFIASPNGDESMSYVSATNLVDEVDDFIGGSSGMQTTERRSPSPFQNNSNNLDHMKVSIVFKEGTDFTSKKVFTLRRNALVMEVKNKASSAFDLPVTQQEWTGWPKDTENYDALSSLGVSSLNLQLKRKAGVGSSNLKTENGAVAANVGGSSAGGSRAGASSMQTSNSFSNFDFYQSEFTDPDDEEQCRGNQPIGGKRLLEDKSSDCLESQEMFMFNFRERYGESHPIFFLGSLEQAVENSCMLEAKDRKLLAIYAHHDRSVFANVFCETILSSEHIVNFLNANFIVWGWDCTLDSNKQIFFQSLEKQFGPSTRDLSLRSHKEYPLIIILSRQNGIFDILQVVSGSQSLDEVAATMMVCHDQFSVTITQEIKQEEERKQREQLRDEQNAAYLESLAADRAKEEQRKREEQEKLEAEKKQKQQQAEKARKKEEAQKAFNEQVQPEPDENFKGEITNVRIRTPSNETLTRKFVADSKLSQLFSYVASFGYFPENYKIMTSWPRCELTWDEKNKTFKDKKLIPTATLLIEKRIN